MFSKDESQIGGGRVVQNHGRVTLDDRTCQLVDFPSLGADEIDELIQLCSKTVVVRQQTGGPYLEAPQKVGRVRLPLPVLSFRGKATRVVFQETRVVEIDEENPFCCTGVTGYLKMCNRIATVAGGLLHHFFHNWISVSAQNSP
jgi:hypothetical protein